MEAPNGKANCGKKSGRLYCVAADGAAVPVVLLWAPFGQASHTLTQFLKLSLLVQSLVPIQFSRFSSYYVSSKYYFPFPTPRSQWCPSSVFPRPSYPPSAHPQCLYHIAVISCCSYIPCTSPHPLSQPIESRDCCVGF